MTKWHKEWQNEFNGYTESKYESEKMHKKYRRADVDLNDTHIIEFQHSRMSKEEASNRKDDYAKVNKKINK
jgi:competence CoiA-like predicted nuclease